jgi:Lrp/AsnC family leucine-responsive transcriptional regulator
MDSINQNILKELKLNARLTNQQLAKRVSLSPSPCLRRVRNLEKSGIIKGYTTVVDLASLGYTITAMVNVRLEKHSQAIVEEFESGVKTLDEVVACYLISGSNDYLLQVITKDLKTYEKFIRNQLQKIPGIGFLESNFIFDEIKNK